MEEYVFDVLRQAEMARNSRTLHARYTIDEIIRLIQDKLPVIKPIIVSLP